MPARDYFSLARKAQIFSFLISLLFLSFLFLLLLISSHQINGLSSFIVASGSMEPHIPTGSVVVTQRRAEYVPHDVVTFLANGNRVTHRIVSKEEIGKSDYYATKGDANNVEDSYYTYGEAIIGKTIIAVPFIGSFIELINTNKMLVLLPMLPTIYLFIILLQKLLLIPRKVLDSASLSY